MMGKFEECLPCMETAGKLAKKQKNYQLLSKVNTFLQKLGR